MEAITLRLEAIAIRLQAIASRLEAILGCRPSPLGWRPSLLVPAFLKVVFLEYDVYQNFWKKEQKVFYHRL